MPTESSDVEVVIATGGHMGAYLAKPAQPNGTTLVVLQEIFGINANMREVTDGFADAGFLAIAPDLFWRQQPGVRLDPASKVDYERAGALMRGLDVDQAIQDAGAALDWARKLQAEGGRAQAVGYCLGGKLAFLMAARGLVDRAVSYYGVGIQGVLPEASAIKGKVLLHVAQEDALCPPGAQTEIATAMAPLGERSRILSYPGVGHAFARRGGAGYDQASAERAGRETLAFLGEGLA